MPAARAPLAATCRLERTLASFDRAIGLEVTLRAAPSGDSGAALAAGRPQAPRWELPATSLAPPGDLPSRSARLAEIASRHAARCPLCTRASGWRNLVFGEGAPDAAVMFVGEAPGEADDLLGRPFIGPAGEKLDEMIQAMGLAREAVYLANVLKSRLPANRPPQPSEVAECAPFLVEQLLAVRPRAIVALGGSATSALLGVDTAITRLRGTWLRWHPPAGACCKPIPLMPTYHPAYVLSTYTVEVRRQVWSDLREVMAALREAAGPR